MRLFDRTAALTVETKTFKTRLQFQIEKSEFGESASGLKIAAFNLSQESRNFVENATSIKPKVVRLTAGYGGENLLIYFGEIFYVWSERREADIVTVFEGGSGQRSIQEAHLELSGQKNDLEVYKRILEVFKTYGISKGKLAPDTEAELLKGTYQKGYAESGPITHFLNLIVKRHKLTWSINDFYLNIYSPRNPVENSVVVLSQETGMIGFPSKTTHQTYKVKSLLNAVLDPGKFVQVKTKTMTLPSLLKVFKVTHEGDTLEGPWDSDLELATPNFTPDVTTQNE